jgi:hypothetical protein
MSEIREVTDKVDFGWNEDECLPIIECVCGTEFDLWEQVLGVYKDDPWSFKDMKV